MNNKFLSFEEWLANNPDLEEKYPAEACFKCNGDGEIECEVCGSFVECKECNGTGETTNSELLSMYKNQLEHDKRLYEQYSKEKDKHA